MKHNIKIIALLAFSLFSLFSITGCKDDKEDIYYAELIVLQKDAYSDTPGRNHDLIWPPHTTTVFKWKGGEEIQLNHGTAPDEADASGVKMQVDLINNYILTGEIKLSEKVNDGTLLYYYPDSILF